MHDIDYSPPLPYSLSQPPPPSVSPLSPSPHFTLTPYRKSLMGTGVRVKKIGPAGVKVYAVGLYVEEKGAVKELDAHK